MTKIDKNWRIGCATGDEMNEVWQVLRDAGEPMFTHKANYSSGGVMAVPVGDWSWWLNSSTSANITYKEFMEIMTQKTKGGRNAIRRQFT